MVRSDERWTMYWIKMRVPNVVCRRKARYRQPITDYGAVGLIIRLLPKTMSEGEKSHYAKQTAYTIGGLFFELYWRTEFRDIAEIGSYNVNGTLRELRPPGSTYIGLYFEDGPGVDLRIRMHQKLPLENQAADLVLASSVFEHDPCFWETFLPDCGASRGLGALFTLIARRPTAGSTAIRSTAGGLSDAGEALAQWACRCGQDVELVESCLAEGGGDNWNDFVAVFYKKGTEPLQVLHFLTDSFPCANVKRYNETELRHCRVETEDILVNRKLQAEIEDWKSREGFPGREQTVQRIEQLISELQLSVQMLRGTLISPGPSETVMP